MSQENVEIVKNAYRGLDERGVDGLLEFIHEDVEFAMNSRGRGSGVEVANEGFQVWHFRDGRGARIEEYVDRAEALEAAGLSE